MEVWEMGPTEQVCALLKETAKVLRGAERRRFIAHTVEAYGLSQRQAEGCLGWCRETIRKALHERRSGITCVDNFSARGRLRCEDRLPGLFQDIRDLVKDHLQTDYTFRTTQLFCRLTASAVRRQLIDHKGYSDGQLPCLRTITTKLNDLGFRLRLVAKNRPQKG
jgi:hypothetical protein